MPDLSKLKTLVPEGEPEWRYSHLTHFISDPRGRVICREVESLDAREILAIRAAWPLVWVAIEAAKAHVEEGTEESMVALVGALDALDALKVVKP